MEWPVAPTGPVARFIRAVGERLARAAGPAPFPWRFTVIRSRAANAFSIGGGRIYVNEGTPFACDDEAELAAILSHEMGHELAGHFRGPPTGPASTGWFGARSSDATRTIGSVHQPVDPAREREADRISVEILERAGYDPHAALRIARRLAPSDRPADAARLRALQELLADAPATGRRSSDEFRRLKRNVPQGAE